MTRTLRTGTALAISLALGACAAPPPPAADPPKVAVRTDALSLEYSSFNTRVLSEAGAIEHSFTASLDPAAEPLTRLESTYTQTLGSDERQRVRVGDTVSSVGMWGSSVRFGGMQFGTRSARADVITASRLATPGLAVLPTVEDALFASLGDASTADDTFGRSDSIEAPTIATTQLIQQGCSDFSVGVGKVRRDYAVTSNEYGPLFASTTVACAAPLGFTVEGHGEYLADQVAALGFGVARQIGPVGTASLAVAQSRAEEGSGWLARFGLEHSNSLFDFKYRSRVQSREYRQLGGATRTDPIMQRDLASIGVNVTEGANLSLAYATQMTWDRERTNLIALKQSLAVGRGSLAMSAGHSLTDNFGSSVFISYRRPLGIARAPARSLVEELDLDLLHATPLAP